MILMQQNLRVNFMLESKNNAEFSVRTNLNIFHVHNNVHNMMESQTSKNTDITPSYHVGFLNYEILLFLRKI